MTGNAIDAVTEHREKQLQEAIRLGKLKEAYEHLKKGSNRHKNQTGLHAIAKVIQHLQRDTNEGY